MGAPFSNLPNQSQHLMLIIIISAIYHPSISSYIWDDITYETNSSHIIQKVDSSRRKHT